MAFDERTFTRRILITAAIVVALAAALTVVVMARNILLLAFGGLLFGLLLQGISARLQHWTGLSHPWSLSLATLIVIAVAALLVLLLAPRIAEQGDVFAERLPRALSKLHEILTQYGWGRSLMAQAPEDLAQALMQSGEVVSRVRSLFSGFIAVIGSIVLVFFIGLFIAVEPERYMNGMLKLFPPDRRPHMKHVAGEVGHTLLRWLSGRLLDMAILALLTWVGLMLLGMPLALTLAVLAGLLSFIPNLGPVLALIPAVLLAFLEGPWMALWVFLLYIGLQSLESYIILPLIQRYAIHMPPALLLTAQLVLASVAGFLGLLLATPLTAAAMKLTGELYVQDVLESGGER